MKSNVEVVIDFLVSQKDHCSLFSCWATDVFLLCFRRDWQIYGQKIYCVKLLIYNLSRLLWRRIKEDDSEEEEEEEEEKEEAEVDSTVKMHWYKGNI